MRAMAAANIPRHASPIATANRRVIDGAPRMARAIARFACVLGALVLRACSNGHTDVVRAPQRELGVGKFWATLRAMRVDVRDARFLALAVDVAGLPAPAFAEIAFAGRSNVGKSSLINNLVVRKKLVRTSNTPGATRGLGLFRADFVVQRKDQEPQTATLDLVDLPGYGYAKRSKHERRGWGPMIEGYLERRISLRTVVLIVDVRRGPGEEDEQLLEYLDHIGKPTILVATKLDKLPPSQQLLEVAKIKASVGRPVVGVSSETGEGRDRLWTRILAAAGIGLAESRAETR
jgi:GTP-binding protein